MKDYYSILGISRNSCENDIKKAYKKLAFQYHPDKNKSDDAETKFREISEAYDILSNADKRRMYDNFGYDSVSGDIPQINPLDLFQSLFNVDFTGLGENMNSNIFVFSDLSSMPFGPLQHKMTYNLECSLEELYHGTQKEFHISHLTKKGKGETINKSTKYVINVKRGSKQGDNIVVKEGGNYIPQLDITEDLAIQIMEVEHPLTINQGQTFININVSTLVYQFRYHRFEGVLSDNGNVIASLLSTHLSRKSPLNPWSVHNCCNSAGIDHVKVSSALTVVLYNHIPTILDPSCTFANQVCLYTLLTRPFKKEFRYSLYLIFASSMLSA